MMDIYINFTTWANQFFLQSASITILILRYVGLNFDIATILNHYSLYIYMYLQVVDGLIVAE